MRKQSTKVQRVCRRCGTPILVLPSVIRAGGGHYCTYRCYRAEPRKPLAERFWSKVDKGNGCWLWLGSLRSTGYGQINAGQHGVAPLKAHRVAYELTYGPIPDGLFVCHHCDNRRCVRPDHLFLGTPSENTADAGRKGRMGRSRLTEATVQAIRAAYAQGEAQSSLAKRYGVHQSTISKMVRGKNWKHLPV